jgi:phosphoribosylanthranilate isomerase
MTVRAKICGINDAPAIQAAIDGAAAFVGLVFYPPSPRNVTPEAAAPLAALVPADIVKVGLFVDPDGAASISASSGLTPHSAAPASAWCSCTAARAPNAARRSASASIFP